MPIREMKSPAAVSAVAARAFLVLPIEIEGGDVTARADSPPPSFSRFPCRAVSARRG
jgi:hypothetical protein